PWKWKNACGSTLFLLRRLQRLFNSAEYLALDSERMARDARAGCGFVTAAAEFRRDFVHVYIVILGAKADAGEFGLQFFEETGHFHGRDGANVIDQTLRIVRFRAGAGEVFFLEPEISDLVVVHEAEGRVNVLQQARARERIGLINFVANFREVRAARDQFRA